MSEHYRIAREFLEIQYEIILIPLTFQESSFCKNTYNIIVLVIITQQIRRLDYSTVVAKS